MEVVLLEDVKALGKKGQIVKVNDGYARNFILPKKLGVEANIKESERSEAPEGQRSQGGCRAAGRGKGPGCRRSTKLSVTVSIKAGEGGKDLWLRFHKGDRQGSGTDQLHLDIDKKKMVLTDPIRRPWNL